MRTASAIIIALPALAAALVALTRYPGSPAVFVAFNVCFFLLAAAAVPRPRLYAYTVLVALTVLGCWAKALVHTIWSPNFLEPVGGFSGSPAEWDAALMAMSAGALGMLAARLIHILYRRRRPQVTRASAGAPAWFMRRRRAVWAITLAAMLIVNAANLQFAFYQIGVNVKWVMPLRLHVLFAWLVNIGLALWIAGLLWWDHRSAGTLSRGIVAAFFEALVSSVSAFSRILYLVHAAPYWLALFEERRRLAAGIHRRSVALLAACFLVFLVASVFAVFLLRASYYPSNADVGRNIKLEIPQLVVQRWVGLEGVLTLVAEPARGMGRLLAALADSPKAGTESLYQRTARSRYHSTDTPQFTFGTNAGPIAILLYSGSLVVVSAGMALIMAVVALTEEAAAHWTGNPFLVALAATALANVVSQTTFFYLTLVFGLQLWLALALIAVLSRPRA